MFWNKKKDQNNAIETSSNKTKKLTQVINSKKVLDSSNHANNIDDELLKLSKEDLEYRLKFTEKDPIIIKKIKLILKNK